MSVNRQFAVGDLVFAQVHGHPAWPARIEASGVGVGKGINTKYRVFFYGTYDTADVKGDKLWHYDEESKARFGGVNRRKRFDVALKEIEKKPDICTAEEWTARDAAIAAAAAAAAKADDDRKDKFEVVDDDRRERKMEMRGTKRKAEMSDSMVVVAPPAAKRTRRRRISGVASSVTPEAVAGSAEKKKTSKFGRTLTKPDRFKHEDFETDKEECQSMPSETKKPPRKMLMTVLLTGDVIEVNLDSDRPDTFESAEAETRWEKHTLERVLMFKERIESGKLVPEKVLKRIEMKTDRTEQEEKILRIMNSQKEKMRWLAVERSLVDVTIKLRQSLRLEDPDMSAGLEALEQLSDLPYTPLMFKKQPGVVSTIMDLTSYAGPESITDPEMVEMARRIRLKAQQMYTRLRWMFGLTDVDNFWEEFKAKVSELRDAVKDMDPEAAKMIVSDPTKKVVVDQK